MLKIIKKMLRLREISGVDNALMITNQINEIEKKYKYE